MEIFALNLIALALLLGIKHSFDADHLVAVSGLLTHSSSLRTASLLSVSWASGHMITATIITIILFTFKETLLKNFFSNLSMLVPIMLIIIAVITLVIEFDVFHYHKHSHAQVATNEKKEHAHFHMHISRSNRQIHGAMVGIGIVHGLASNDELLLLFTLVFGLENLYEIIFVIIIFTIGVIIGMVGYALSLNYPMRKWGNRKVSRIVNVTIAGLSLVYATWLLAGLEGLNVFELF